LIEQTPKKWLAGSSFVIFLAVLFQHFGEIVYITRLDRIMDPIRLAERAWNLWSPYSDMGAIQYQTSGYWISFDSFFAVGSIVQVPVWLTERFYIAILLIVALWGLVRLADALAIGRPVFRLIAGLGYALSPMLLGRAGNNPAILLSGVLLPWVLLPLITGTTSGSTRRAAMRSGIAIALMGGANASATLAVLPVPVLYLLTRERGIRRTSLIRWWVLAIPLATLWWLVGLWFLARYGADVIRYTESASVTTSVTSIFDVLRGSAEWSSKNRWFDIFIPSGYSIAFRSIPIISSTLLTAIGLVGLSRKDLPERKFLLSTFFLGVVLVGGGFGGLFGSPLADLYQAVLGGPLGAFRNVYKFQPLITLPLSLGVAYSLTRLAQLPLFNSFNLRKVIIPITFLIVVVAGAFPLWTNQLIKGPGFHELPKAWEQARDYIDKNNESRVLVLPSLPVADYRWGFLVQNPLEWGSEAVSATRSQAPIGGYRNIEFLDAIERTLDQGGNLNLPNFLHRGGFSKVLVVNDGSYEKYGNLSPASISRALTASGLTLKIGFGEIDSDSENRQQIEIYSIPKTNQVQTYSAAQATWVSGDIESTLNIPENDFGERAYILVSDKVPKKISPNNWIVTDGNQRYGMVFGLNRNNRTYTLGPNENSVNGIPLDEQQFFDENIDNQTVQIEAGIKRIFTSSTGFFLLASPGAQPANIYDADSNSSWFPTQFGIRKSDEWVETVFKKPRTVSPAALELSVTSATPTRKIWVRTATDNGERTTVLRSVETPQRLNVVSGKTKRLRVTIEKRSFSSKTDILGIRELKIPGAPFAKRLIVPDELTQKFSRKNSNDPAWVFTRDRPSYNDLFANGESEIKREFNVPKQAELNLIATGSASNSLEAINLIGTTPKLKITASSTFNNSLRYAPRRLLDTDSKSGWIADPRSKNTNPVLNLSWTGDREISGFKFNLFPGASVLKKVIVRSDDQERQSNINPDGSVAFAPLIGENLKITLVPKKRTSEQLSSVIALAGIEIPAIADLYPELIDLEKPIIIPCESGPILLVDNNKIKFSGTTTLGKFADSLSLTLSSCGENSVTLPQGINKIDTKNGKNLLAFDQIVLGNPPLLPAETKPSRQISIKKWGDADRSVTIGAGKENILVVNEIFNEGWAATYRGHELNPMQIDGWRQGFYVPSGPAGKIALSFTPNSAYQTGVIIGLILLIGLFVLAIWPDRKKRNYAPIGKKHWSSAITVTIAIAAAIWCTGAGAIALPLLWWIKIKWPRALPVITFSSFMIAGTIVLFTKGTEGISDTWSGSYSYPTSFFAALAFLSVVAAFLPVKVPNQRETTS